MSKIDIPVTDRYEFGEIMPADHVNASLDVFSLYGTDEVEKLVHAIGSKAIHSRGGGWLKFDISKFNSNTPESVRVLSEWFTDLATDKSVRGGLVAVQSVSTNYDIHEDPTNKITTAISRLSSVGTEIFPNISKADYKNLRQGTNLESSQSPQDLNYGLKAQNGQMVIFRAGVFHQEPHWDHFPAYTPSTVRVLFSAG